MDKLDFSTYFTFFKKSNILCFIVDDNGVVISVNDIAQKVINIYETQNLKLENINNIINNKQFTNKLLETLEKGEKVFEFEITSSKNQTMPYEIYSKKIIVDNNTYIACSAHTVINKKEVENKILSAVIETEEKERSRFAKDLHDGLGPLLSTIKLYVHELNSDDNTKNEKEEYINYIIELLDEAVTNTREISNNLTPQIISTYGLVKSIDSFKNKINATHKLEISFTNRNIPDNLEKTIKLTLFRIITELINNSIKHASANNIFIDLFSEKNILHLNYKDDGIGFNLSEALKKGSSGIGLTNIINRIKSLSGNFYFNEQVKIGVDMQFSIEIITEDE